HQLKIVSVIYPAIGDRILAKKNQMINEIDKLRRVTLPSPLSTGSVVMLRDPDKKDKFEPKYIGPYIIARRTHRGNYVLRDMTGDILDRAVPMDQLKLLANKARKKDKDSSAAVYTVDRIINHRGDPGHYEYLTVWKGYS